MSDKVYCDEQQCGWHGLFDETLSASNPFGLGEIYACPKCKKVQEFKMACDEPNCWEPASCGTPIPNGYRETCGKHMPKT